MEDKPIADKVIRFVLSMPDEEFCRISVRKLSQLLKVDRFKLLREFKHQVAMTLEEFLFKERMGRAAYLLLCYRDISIKEVAEKMGFCTCDYFVRVFRQHYGVVPVKYRQYKTMRSGVGERQWLKERDQKPLQAETRESGIGNSCENCYLRKCVLNFDDRK